MYLPTIHLLTKSITFLLELFILLCEVDTSLQLLITFLSTKQQAQLSWYFFRQWQNSCSTQTFSCISNVFYDAKYALAIKILAHLRHWILMLDRFKLTKTTSLTQLLTVKWNKPYLFWKDCLVTSNSAKIKFFSFSASDWKQAKIKNVST